MGLSSDLFTVALHDTRFNHVVRMRSPIGANSKKHPPVEPGSGVDSNGVGVEVATTTIGTVGVVFNGGSPALTVAVGGGPNVGHTNSVGVGANSLLAPSHFAQRR